MACGCAMFRSTLAEHAQTPCAVNVDISMCIETGRGGLTGNLALMRCCQIDLAVFKWTVVTAMTT